MKRYAILLLLWACFISTLQAQVLDTSDLKDIKVRNVGPAGMSGRITCIDVVRHDPEHIFVGSASGGVWESTNGGTNWKPIFDDQPTLAIGALAIDPNNADVIWVGTGEGNPRNSHNSGKGLYKSINGGRSWTCMGLEETKTIHRILVNPMNSQEVYVGATGSAWGSSPHRGLYKTVDGGENWEKILFNNDSTGVGDMVMDPSNPQKLLVAMWEHGRKPWTFTSGGKGSGLYLTYDGGKNFKKLSEKNGLPKGELGRIGLAFAPSQPDIVYALIEAKENALYKSEDGGHQWKKVGTKNVGNRPFYYSDIFVDPHNENRIYSLWSYVSRSEDGGKSFKTIMDYGNHVHPDHHALYIHPDDPDYLINGNDGGLNISRDGGENWQFITNLPVGQFYHIAIDTTFPYRIYGGMQDNGSWMGPSAVLRRGGIRNHDWQEIYFGDGFDVLPIWGDERYGYAMSQGGNVARYDLETGKTTFVKPLHDGEETLRFNWNAAIAGDPFDMNALYFGSQMVHYSNDRGRSWETISPDLTTNDTTKQKQDESGGLTIDATQAENHTTILCITPDPFDRNTIWVGTDDGRLQLTRDRGDTWNDVAPKCPGMPSGSWIPQIVSGNKPGHFFVVVNDYRRNNWSAFTYETRDYGQNFTRLVDDSDVDGFVCAIAQDPVDDELLFLGTDVGLYFSRNGGKNWIRWHDNLPHVQIRDLKIHPKEHDLVIGTFGRSIWVIDDISFLRKKLSNDPDEFTVINTGPGYLTSTKSYAGIRFYAQGEWIGDNAGYGAAYVNYYGAEKKKVKKEEEAPKERKKNRKKKIKNQDEEEMTQDSTDQSKKASKEGMKKDKKIHVVVFDQNGDTLRYFSQDKKKGYQRIYWSLRRNGIHYPSYKKPKKDANPPGGLRVSPGLYTTTIRWKDQLDTVQLEVKPDPRRSVDEGNLEEQVAWVDSFYQQVTTIRTAFDYLSDIKKNVESLEKSWEILPDSLKDTFNAKSKKMIGTIDSLQNLIVAKPGQKGIPDRSQYLSASVWRTYSYLAGEDEGYGTNVERAMSIMVSKSQPILEAIRAFTEETWEPFKTYYETLNVPVFTPKKTIKTID